MTSKQALGYTALFVFAVGTGLGMSRKPWIVYREQQIAAREQRATMRVSEANRADLLRSEARVRSGIGQEELARTRGFMNPGEEPADKD